MNLSLHLKIKNKINGSHPIIYSQNNMHSEENCKSGVKRIAI